MKPVRPPLRVSPFEPDQQDEERIRYVNRHWDSQTSALLARDREIEEGLRMLAGQQWHVWHERFNRYIDVTEWMDEDERLWRQRPVFNRLILWFILTHARVTEGSPIFAWLPGPDRIDAELAEMMDILTKVTWREAGMVDVMDRLAAWLLPAGTVYGYSRIDRTRGPLEEWTGEAELPLEVPVSPNEWEPLLDPDGQPIRQTLPSVPLDEEGNPVVRLTLQGPQPLVGPDGQPRRPFSERQGQIAVDVLSPLQVRGQWGHHIPWHQKSWHARDLFLTTEEVAEFYQVEVEPDTFPDPVGSGLSADRILFGPGYFGSASSTGRDRTSGLGTSGEATATDGYVRVREFWQGAARFAGMEERKDYPGGRLLIVTQHRVLRDGPRPVAFPYVSPIRCFEFIRLPGRPAGTSPLEFMKAPQRAGNRLAGSLLEHTALLAHPKKVVARGSGLEHVKMTNKPDESYVVTRQPGIPALEYVSPPAIAGDVYKTMEFIEQYLTEIGTHQRNPGTPPTGDPSAKLVQELRYDADRALGPTLRRMGDELARMQEDWRALFPMLYPRERLLAYMGDDNVARSILLQPALFEQGHVNIQPAPESMLPESRGERIARVRQDWLDGAFGPTQSPEAIAHYLELARYPHISRTAKPGGVDRTMAEQNLGKILTGMPAEQIPLFQWYNYAVHRQVYEAVMKGPEFLKLPPAVQGELALLWTNVVQHEQLVRQQQAVTQAAFQESMAPPSAPTPEPEAVA